MRCRYRFSLLPPRLIIVVQKFPGKHIQSDNNASDYLKLHLHYFEILQFSNEALVSLDNLVESINILKLLVHVHSVFCKELLIIEINFIYTELINNSMLLNYNLVEYTANKYFCGYCWS